MGLREGPVARIVRRHRHDRPGSVPHQHIVGDPDRKPFAVDRIDGIAAGEAAGFFLVQFLPLQIALPCSRLAVGCDSRPAIGGGHDFDQRMLGRQDHIRCAEERIGSGGKNPDRPVDPGDSELDFGADRPADPVFLHLERARGPFHQREIIQEPVRVGGNFQHPLAHGFSNDIEPADLALAVNNFFVRQHRSQSRTPIDRNLRHVGQAPFEQLQEDPLCPAIVVGVRRTDFAVPVVRQPHPFHLPLECRNILRRRNGRMYARFDGILFGRQPEGIPAHRMEHVEAPHPLVAGYDIRRRITFQVTDVETGPGGIRKHVEAIEFGLGRIVHRPERALVFPIGLPLGFDGAMVVGLAHGLRKRFRRGRTLT